MLGKDFFVFWQIAQSILSGAPLYSTPESLYPPATLLFFVPLGMLPFNIAFALWSGINVLLYTISVRSMSKENVFGWFLFTPTLFILLTGQIDIIFLWVSTFLTSNQIWKKVLAAVILTLKPQIAFIVLPWVLFRWIKQQPKTIFLWGAGCLFLHGLPLLIDPGIYSKWIEATRTYSENRLLLSPGIFGLSNFSISIWVLGIFALVIMIFGLFQNESISRTAQILALPMGIWYENIFLLGVLSWKWLVPISWVCYILAYFLKTSSVLILIPISTFLTLIIKQSNWGSDQTHSKQTN
ncbi:MAG: glycosyltransferase family 87 protein [Anaerolineaceae bacterium]